MERRELAWLASTGVQVVSFVPTSFPDPVRWMENYLTLDKVPDPNAADSALVRLLDKTYGAALGLTSSCGDCRT
ncbi:hypothetical protein AXG93_1515s1030 [Marchantia polymorpha subsp. ruderalis]|uniref:Uncharacterized protein n=1 Tax=Marchantia polymorpha subsp. ruderalis TaxID=1480154 RepID=A0A176WPI3_MARPO|nr:hypothetical protein AXG93_1515s1030 [Marchantia polymorpha subsp. ruderalis]